MNSELFDLSTVTERKSDKPAQARNIIGECAAVLACRALGMQPLAVDSREKVCPDADWNGRKVEIKSVGRETMHGSQRAGYVEGGWQFRINRIKPDYSTATKLNLINRDTTVTIQHAYP